MYRAHWSATLPCPTPSALGGRTSVSSSVAQVCVDKPMTLSPPCLAVITGIGCVSPLGVGGYDVVANMLRTNRSAIGPLSGFPTTDLACRLGAEIPAASLPDVD